MSVVIQCVWPKSILRQRNTSHSFQSTYLLPITHATCIPFTYDTHHIHTYYPSSYPVTLSPSILIIQSSSLSKLQMMFFKSLTSVPNIRRLRAFKPIQFLWAARNKYLYLRQCKCTCTCTSYNVPVPQPMYLYPYLKQCICTPDNVPVPQTMYLYLYLGVCTCTCISDNVPVPQTMYLYLYLRQWTPLPGPIFATFKPIHFLWGD